MQKSKEQRALARLGQGMVDSAAHPAAQLAGYLQTGDPTYLPPGPLRRMAHHLEPDRLLEALAAVYLAEHCVMPAAADPA